MTQADVDAGSVTNTATATATAPDPHTISSNSSSVTVNASGATSSLTLSQTWTKTTYKAASKTIHFSELVTNTGTTTLSDVSVGDNLMPSVSCPHSTLAPSANETCTGSYVTTQTDVDSGSVTSNATASAVTPYANNVFSAPSAVTVNYAGVTITTTSLPNLHLNVPYSHQLAATGGRGPYVWAAVSSLPKGLTLSAGGLLHGTVLSTKVSPGIYPVTIQVTSTYGGHTQKFVRTLNLTVKA